ncbi:MAG TPA: hypothetical protein VLL27_02205 [Solirubrobacterales bacterium]|nr:hypothetical protein [Solirubrobacterales bacterium]
MPSNRDSEALYRLSRRSLGLAGVLGVLLIAVVVNHWLHDGEETINPFNPIAAAASQTQSAAGYTAKMNVIYSVPDQGQPVRADGELEYNATTGRARANLSVPTPAGTFAVESVASSHHVYVRSDAFGDMLPAGAEWIGIEPLIGQTSPGFAGSEGAQDQLQMLRAVGDVETVGTEAVNGVETHRYRGTIYFDRVIDLFEREGEKALADKYRQLDDLMPDTIPVEVWIAPDGTVREVLTVTTLPSQDGRPEVTMDMRITMDQVGVSPEIDLPDPGSVYNATPALRQQLQGLSA